MEQYLSNMFERTNHVISNVINEVFHMHPNLLTQIRSMYEAIENELKSTCKCELELVLAMEESFVYADNPLYKDTLKRIKRIQKQYSDEPITTTVVQSARIPYTASTLTNSRSTLKRTSGAISEDNEDDADDEPSPRIKISRSNNSSTSRFSTCKLNESLFPSKTLLFSLYSNSLEMD